MLDKCYVPCLSHTYILLVNTYIHLIGLMYLLYVCLYVRMLSSSNSAVYICVLIFLAMTHIRVYTSRCPYLMLVQYIRTYVCMHVRMFTMTTSTDSKYLPSTILELQICSVIWMYVPALNTSVITDCILEEAL